MGDSRLQVWTLAARPRTLPAAAAPVLMGAAMALGRGRFHLWSALAAMLGALLIQIGTNYANDYYDWKKGSDREDRTGPTRATQARMVAPSSMKRAAWITFSLAIVVGVYLVMRGGWPILIVGLLSILFGVLYTGGPFPLGYNGLGELFVLIFFGPVALGGTYYVQALSIDSSVIITGLAPGLFSVAILAVNNLRDIEQDRLSGKKTLAVLLGLPFARAEYTLSMVAGALIPASLAIFAHNPAAITLSALVLPLSFTSIWAVWQDGPPERLNNVLASTGQVLLLFAVLYSIGWLL